MTLPARSLSALIAVAALALAVLPVQRISAQPDDSLPNRVALPTAIPTLILPPVPSVAPGYRAPQAEPSAAHIIGVTEQPFVGISLQDAIAMALLKNPNLAVSASNFRVARYTVVQTKGAYDVGLLLQPQSNFSVNPPQNFLAAGPGGLGHYPGISPTQGPGNIIEHQSAFTYGVSGQTENGTTVQATIQQSRTYNNTVFDAFNPYYLAALNLAVDQPLLKNAGMNAGKRRLKLAIVNADAGTAQTLIDASSAIAQVETTYWSLVAAWRDVAIQEEALRQAIAQQQSNIRLAQRGAAAPIDAVESQTQVSNFQDAVFRALETVSALQNQLKMLVAGNAQDPVWNANLVPSTSVELPPNASDLAAIVAAAKQNRPEVRQAEDRRLQAEIDRAFAKNQALPQADVQAQYESNGFAGHPSTRSQVPHQLLSGQRTLDVSDAAAEHARSDGLGLSQHVGGLLSNVQHRAARRLCAAGARRAGPARPIRRGDDAGEDFDAGRAGAHRCGGSQRAANLSVRRIEARGGARGAKVRRSGVRERSAQVPPRPVDDVPRAAAPSAARAGSRQRAAGADAARSGNRRDPARRRNDSHDERRQRRDAGQPGAGALGTATP